MAIVIAIKMFTLGTLFFQDSFVMTTPIRFLRPGSPLELTCPAIGDPLPSVAWEKDGEPLVNTDMISTDWFYSGTMNKENTSRLVIQNMTVADQGVYSCFVSGNGTTQTLVLLTTLHDRLIDKSFLTDTNNEAVRTILTQYYVSQTLPGTALQAMSILQDLFPFSIPLKRVHRELQELTQSFNNKFTSDIHMDVQTGDSQQGKSPRSLLFEYIRTLQGVAKYLPGTVNISLSSGRVAVDLRSSTTEEFCEESREVGGEIWIPEDTSVCPSSKMNDAGLLSGRVSIIQARFPRLDEKATIDSRQTSVASDLLAYIVMVDGLTTSVPVTFKLQPNTINITGPHHNLTHRWNFLCGFMLEENVRTSRSHNDDSLRLPGWSTLGCSLISTLKDALLCACNHTTNFAILMQVVPIEMSAANARALSIITYVGCGISIVSLIMALTVFTILRLYVEDRTYNHMHLIVTMLILQAVFLSGVGQVSHQTLCTAVTVILHYLCLSMFSWMLVEGVHLYYQVVVVFRTGKNMKLLYTIFGYGCPCVIVAISAGAFWPGYSDTQRTACWLSMTQAFHWSFLGPAIAVISINVVIAIRVMYVIMRAASTTKYPVYCVLACKALLIISPITGLGWSFALMAVSENTIIFQYLFSACNSLQGLFVFLLHCVFNQEVRNAWAVWRNRKVSFRLKASSLSDVKSVLPSISPPIGHAFRGRISQASTQITVSSTASSKESVRTMSPLSNRTPGSFKPSHPGSLADAVCSVA